MFTALDINGNKIAIADAKKDEEYFCPVCNGRLRIKAGQVNAKHFAHVSLQDCDDFSSDMSEWHRAWQEKFPLKNREVVIECDGEKHRADVLAYGYVIEFQHSPISREEFNRRNKFYTKAGKKVIWIFDLTYINFGLGYYAEWSSETDNGAKWDWPHCKRCFEDFTPQMRNDVILFFQFWRTEFTNEKERYIERVVWSIGKPWANFRRFNTSYHPGNKTELLDWMKNGRL